MNVIWRKEWLYKYESPWSVFEKLALVNLADRNEILRLFGNPGTQSIKHYIGDKRRGLFELDGFNHVLLQQTLSINLKEHNQNTVQLLINPFLGLYSSWEYWFHNELHWCSECMKGGYHSWFHQFKLLDECVFHKVKLINSCPGCKEPIPFLLSNKQLDHAFMCKCGHLLTNLHSSSWNEWKGPGRINQDILDWLQSNEIKGQSKWITLAQHCNLKSLIKAVPEEIYNYDEIDGIHQHLYYSSRFQNDLLRVCSAAFQRVEEGLLNSMLDDHRHCIIQLKELRKTGKLDDFPLMCPYAYAYVFWRKSLLKEEYFYGDSRLCRTIENNSFYKSPLIIRDHLEYFTDQIVSHQMNVWGQINPNSLFWVLDKIVTAFSENFFKAWLSIAEKRSKETSVPRWEEIEKMRDLCFPKIAFKFSHNEKGRSTSSIEFYHSVSEEHVIQLECPYQDERSKEETHSMSSFTPQKIAMMIMSNPDDENIQLQKSVDLYVKKLNF